MSRAFSATHSRAPLRSPRPGALTRRERGSAPGRRVAAPADLDAGPPISTPAAPLLAFSIPALVYGATAARGLVWGDGPELAAVAASLGIAHPTGYPLFTLLGHLVCRLPWGTPALRMTLFCAALVALTCVLMHLLLCRLGEDARGRERALWPLAGALVFAFCSAPWSHATRIEVYGLQLLLQLAGSIVALEHLRSPTPRRCVAVAVLWGLAVGHHLLALAWAPLVVACLLRPMPGEPRPARRLARPALGFALSLLPLLYVPLRAAASPGLNFGDPSSPRRWLWTLKGGDYPGRYLGGEAGSSAEVLGRLGEIARFLAEQLVPLPSPAATPMAATVGGGVVCLLALLGLAELSRRRPLFGAAWAATGVLYLGILIAYDIADISDYQLGFWGWLWPLCWLGLRRATRLAPAGGVAAPGRRQGLGLLALAALLLLANWPRHDRSGRRAPDRYAERLFAGLPVGAVLVTEGDAATATAWYLQHAEGRRRDIVVICLHLLDARWYRAQLAERGLWRGPETTPGTSLGISSLLRQQVLTASPPRPVFAVLGRRTARELGSRLEAGRELLTGRDLLEIAATGEAPPAHHRLRLFAETEVH